MPGYAVVDLETTGLRPGWNDRIVEVAVVQVDVDGQVEATWTTLVNPDRDLGPQGIHGIRAADVRHAPRFEDVAGTLAQLLAGRVLVAHNAAFDLGFLTHAFRGAGWDVPLVWATTLCTMRTTGMLLPDAPRSLAGCCAHLGVPLDDAHQALADALAAAGVLRHLLAARDAARAASRDAEGEARDLDLPWWDLALELADTAAWPDIPVRLVPTAQRGVALERDTSFLSRLADRLPRVAGTWEREQYLGLLDRALLDRHISAREHDQLAAAAEELGIDAATAAVVHREYLGALCRAAGASGAVGDADRDDLRVVAGLLGIPDDEVDVLLAAHDPASSPGPTTVPAFSLAPGDLVVLTGETSVPRSTWEARLRAAGLVPQGYVTKAVRLVVAADPDSLSTKARKAEQYGIPVVGEEALVRLLG